MSYLEKPFKWTRTNEEALFLLAEGHTAGSVAKQVGVTIRTIFRWKAHPDFMDELDRLTHMLGVATRAERLRIAKRVVRQKVTDSIVATEKDLLDWLKYLQGETDGVKLDLTTLLEAAETGAGSGSGSTRVSPEAEAEEGSEGA